jgi:hypothetical protein
MPIFGVFRNLMSKFRSTRFKQPKTNNIQRLHFKKADNTCNICEQKATLTDDHVPPRCCGNDKAIIARRIYAEQLIARQVDAKSLNGLKWRTLCRSCNGDRLGRWDTALGDLASKVIAFISGGPNDPAYAQIEFCGGAVLRSLLGHALAAKQEMDAVPIDRKLRDYIMGRAPLDPKVGVYWWLYPFLPTVVARDFTWVEVEGEGGGSPGLATVIKFLPLGFMIIDESASANFDTSKLWPLHQHAAIDDNAVVGQAVNRMGLVNPGWPERPMGNHVVLGGRTYTDAVTTVAAGGATISPGKQIQAESWAGGDKTGVFNGLHAFVEIPD